MIELAFRSQAHTEEMIIVSSRPRRGVSGLCARGRWLPLVAIAALAVALLSHPQARPAYTATAPVGLVDYTQTDEADTNLALNSQGTRGANRAATPRSWPVPGFVQGDIYVHDPSMVKIGTQYMVVSTHDQIQVRTSPDRINFQRQGPAFNQIPAWWSRFNSSNDVWAPDVSFHNGKYWLYYSVSSFGSNYSAIGLATSDTGLPGSWVDTGKPIFTSPYPGYDFNAIDPNLLVDKDGKWWLTFGSFRLGIYMIALDPQTGKPSTTDTRIRHLAQRLHVWPDPVEAPFVYYKDGYYYLFVSFDYCCKGVNSTYSIHFGRSTTPDGPYIDQAGRNMIGDGGTTLLATHDTWVIGPGGQSVMHDDADNHDLLIYHYYDGRANGANKLGINYLGWNNGWPYVY